MNIINQLTLRHLKKNKRRTLVTIIGVIISVSMITAVATLGESFLDLYKRQTIANNGEWHVEYSNVNEEQLQAIEGDSNTKDVILSRDTGYALFPDSPKESKPYLFIREYNETVFQYFPYKLSKGRFPQAENELLISEEIMKNGKATYEIGDTITLDIGERHLPDGTVIASPNETLIRDETGVIEHIEKKTTKTYTIVGFMKRPRTEMVWAPGYTAISYLEQKDTPFNAMVVLKKLNNALFSHAEEIAKASGIEKVNFNHSLLRFYFVTNNDSLRSMLYSLTSIIMGIVIVGSVATIYNAFAISVSERSKYLGMLSSVGATKKQKRNSVFFEGAVIGLISIPIGLIAGYAGIGITFSFLNTFIENALGTTEKLQVVITPITLFGAVIISIATIFISAYIPARRASKISAIDAIRQTQDIKLSTKAVKTSKLVRKIFGIEGEIGLKNLKRNRRRYLATVFSLVISIVLYLTVSFFSVNLEKAFVLSQDDISFDIQVSIYEKLYTEQLEQFVNLDYVTEWTMVNNIFLDAWIDESEVSQQVKEVIVPTDDGKYKYNINLHGLDDDSFRTYCEQVGIDPDSLENSDRIKGIAIDLIKYKDKNRQKYVETKTIDTKPGAVIELYGYNKETVEKQLVSDVELVALTDIVPMGILTTSIGGLDIIVSQTEFDKIINGKWDQQVETLLYLNSSDPMATQEAIEQIKTNQIYVYNVHEVRERVEQMLLFMNVFIYGFITLISLISIANILNTISTSIALRKREFAMLKSVGMTPKSFNKMINYESIFYGVKSLLYGLPISIFLMILIYWSLQENFEYVFAIPWLNIIFVIIAIFVIVSVAMLYSSAKIKKQNIIEGLKQENI